MRHCVVGLGLAFACLVLVGACGDDTQSPATGGGGAGGEGGAACDGSLLFGLPNDTTGLDASQCAPSCGCGGELWQPEPWTDARVDALRAWTLAEPYPELLTDPYATTPPASPPGEVCGFEVIDLAQHSYRLTTFASEAEALQAGAIVTHQDACGLCSTLTDLAVYASTPDLTAPVRQCGIDALGQPIEVDIACLEQLGFTKPCAQIWAYNTQHTRGECLSTCAALLNAPYHDPDGSLNDCLQCDEDKSGAVFKYVAGRTRRNTGIPSALCRPCNEVARLAHDYP